MKRIFFLGELSRSQELNMNVTDELHACQHANAILRGELQRLEVENMHLNDSNKLYEKQAKIWKADNKHLEDSLLQHQKITAYIKSKFETLKEKIADDSLSSSLHKNPVEDIVVDIINLMKSYTEIEKRSESPDGTSKDLELKKTSTENHSLTILNETQNPQHKRNETGPTLSNVDVTITTNGRKSAILTENDLESINSSPNNLTYTLKSPQLVRFDQTPKMYQYNTIHSDPHAKGIDKIVFILTGYLRKQI